MNSIMIKCLIVLQLLARDFPADHAAVVKALQAKSYDSIASGEQSAPPLRSKKRRIADPQLGRIAIPAPSGAGESSTAPSASGLDTQPTLEASWGERIITTARQAYIDLLLLRFIVCCAIPFAILDNGFFYDFVNAL